MSEVTMSHVTTRRELPRFTQRISVGDLQVSPFCLGIVGDWRVIPAAFELGINFFFVTTDMHWPLYEASRQGLRDLFASRPGLRDEIVVAGACYPTQPEFCVAPFQELVQALPGLGRVDLLVAGGSCAADLLPRVNVMRGVATALGARAVGASFHDRRAAATAANHGIRGPLLRPLQPRAPRRAHGSVSAPDAGQAATVQLQEHGGLRVPRAAQTAERQSRSVVPDSA
jgi:hypothetical protein